MTVRGLERTVPMFMVACLEMTSGDKGVSSDGLSFDRSCQTHVTIFRTGA